MKLNIKNILALCLGITSCLTLWADIPQEVIDNPTLTAGNLVAYPYPASPVPALTSAPAGYVPFHIEHYGRHGSRWLLKDRDYVTPRDVLRAADKAGVLTSRGRQALATVKRMEKEAQLHYGDLTDVGAQQHRGIAARMYRNFPEIFADSARVDAKSTVVIRCILSMTNELVELASHNPALRISQVSTKANQWFLQNADRDTVAHAVRREAEPEFKRFTNGKVDPMPLMGRLFTDMDYVRNNIDVHDFYNKMFELASNQQSHGEVDELYDLFTVGELYDKWKCNNAGWYLSSGNAPATMGRMPYTQRYLLADFINSADRAIEAGDNSASLRFGHESVVLPMVCFMELNDYGMEVSDLEKLDSVWRNYQIFPMASNIQMIFYHNDSNDVIVKCLLNEKEVTLPAGHIEGPYYHWNDLKQYYNDKLQAFTTRFEK